jgi:hypothetical protein
MTMPKFEPSFVVKALNQVSPGAMVLYNHAIAFAGVNRSAPVNQRAVTLAIYETAPTSRFVYRYFETGEPNVLVPGGGEVIFRPKLDTFTENVALQPSPKLFFGDAPYLVVELPRASEFRLLNLKDGSLVQATVHAMDAFASWEAGVMSLNEFVPLLKI